MRSSGVKDLKTESAQPPFTFKNSGTFLLSVKLAVLKDTEIIKIKTNSVSNVKACKCAFFIDFGRVVCVIKVFVLRMYRFNFA